jgi:serine phosphatase RsbU (regulator of sigma subunit)
MALETLAFVFILLLLLLLQRLNFFLVTEVLPGRYATSSGSLDNVVHWSAALVLGPTVLWMQVILQTASLVGDILADERADWRWNRLRNLFINLAAVTLGPLAGLAFYRTLGGVIPFPGFDPRAIFIGLAATVVQFAVGNLMWVWFAYYYVRIQMPTQQRDGPRTILRFLALTFGLPGLGEPFALLVAGLYVTGGIGAYLYLVAGLIVVSLLANRLSQAVERGRQQASMVQKLEALGRAIINAPPDASTLPDLLKSHLPGMFTYEQIEVRIFPDRTLLTEPDEDPRASQAYWDWARAQTGMTTLAHNDPLPWDPGQRVALALICAPILSAESSEVIGGIHMTMKRKESHWKREELAGIIPGMQSLAAAIASAHQQAEVYERNLAYERAMQELSLAGQIQAQFLPQELPVIPGWQLSAVLKPARQASGDFFDIIPLSNGRIGLVVADVTDKGMGAALYMALARTLIRTYAMEWATQPALALSAANRRILSDTNADQFVTVFYGVLDPSSGRLTYCSAGHNPAYILSAGRRQERDRLIRTGAPLGIASGMTWKQAEVVIEPGEMLVLYTDGVVEAQNEAGEFYDYDRLLQTVRADPGMDVNALQTCLLDSLQGFAGKAPQYDDITLMLVAREG